MTKQEHVELSFSSDKKGRSGLWLKVDQSIPFEWEKIGDYYFLNLSLKKKLPEKIKELRKKYPHAYEPWTKELDDQLEVEFCEGRSTKELCEIFGRHPGAIRSRIRKLELKEIYEH